jgi:rRNA-processing protein FCF1
MKLGSFSVGLPLYEIESEVTYQTVRTPTVFERMVMKLCGDYRATPGIAEMTLSQIFEQQLGVASANELVGPSVENLIYMGVLSSPSSQDYMGLRLADLSLTTDGATFLERDRLPSRSQKTTVSHRYFPLSNSVKSQREDNRLTPPPSRPFVGASVLQPSDCSALVRDAVAKERHEWKTPNTEIHSVQSQVVGVVWEQHQINIECDGSGVLTIKAMGSPDLERWLVVANPDVIWEHILEPILASDASSDWPTLSEKSLRNALTIAPLSDGPTASGTPVASPRTALRVLVDEAQLASHVDEDLVLLKHERLAIQRLTALFRNGDHGIRRLSSKQGTIWLEMAEPSDLPSGFDGLLIYKKDLSPEAHLAGLAKVFWAGQERRALLSLTADKNTGAQVWQTLQAELKSGLSISQPADVYALASLWEPPQETILRWRSRVDTLSLRALIANASDFISALERFSPHTLEDWRIVWFSALADRMVSAIGRLDGDLELSDILSYLTDLDRLIPNQSGEIKPALLTHTRAVSDIESLEVLRKAAGTSITLPDCVIGDALLHKWIVEALTDSNPTLHGPHSYTQPLSLMRSAHQAVLRDVGLKSLQDAANGNLSLRDVKTSALASVTKWQEASTEVRGMRTTLANTAFSAVDQFDVFVGAWRELATQRLAHPTKYGQRLVVLDTSALMLVPDLLSSMRRNDIPVVARRVLEELDGIKESTEEERAQKARAAIRSLERAGQTVRYESEVLDLLPTDWEPTPDNRILSVALYLRLSDVIVVTGDRNLRNKARAENIVAMLPEEYKSVNPNQAGWRDTGGKRK